MGVKKMRTNRLEKKFSIEDINRVAAYIDRANNLIKGKREFEPKFASKVIENLRPYVVKGNVVDMYFQALQAQFKEETRRSYKSYLSELAQSQQPKKKGRWKGFFEDVRYSSGPGDNVYVYG